MTISTISDSSGPSIQLVRGELGRAQADELLGFWAQRGALPPGEARRRLSEVVCVLRQDGAVVGVSSVFAAALPLIGGRRFWVYRSLLDRRAAEQSAAMIQATFEALASAFDGSTAAPLGLCVLLAGEEDRRRFPLVQPADAPLFYAGYLDDGRQVRLAYFEGADISMPPGSGAARFPQPETLPAPGYTISHFAEQDLVSGAEVVEFWQREGALRSVAEAQRRVSEILLVATHRGGGLAGVSTTYLQGNPQLRADLWHTRVFIAERHRRSHLALALAIGARDGLAERFASGADRRAIGVLFDVESTALKHAGCQAVWPLVGSTFIGLGPDGSHVRVNYFPGARTPEPE